jgi:hypothetical protein
MIERIFVNWKTTVIGVVLIGGSFGAVYTGNAKLSEVSAFIIAAFPFFYMKDGKK